MIEMTAHLIEAHTIARQHERRVVWNGSGAAPRYHVRCERCGWLSPALPAIGVALDTPCGGCRARQEGTARTASFVRRAAARQQQRALRRHVPGTQRMPARASAANGRLRCD